MVSSPAARVRETDTVDSALRTVGRWVLLALYGVTPVLLGKYQAPGDHVLGMWDAFGLPKLAFALACTAVLMAIWCVLVLRRDVDGLRWHPVLAAAIALTAWTTIATVTGATPRASVFGQYVAFDGLITWLLYLFILILVPQFVRTRRDVREVAIALTVGGVLVGTYAILQWAGLDPQAWVARSFGARPFATFGNPIALGAFLVVPWVMALGLACAARPPRAMWAWVAAASVCSSALVLSGTRGAWLGAFAAVTVLCVYLIRAKWRPELRHWAAAGLLVLVVAGTGVATWPEGSARLATLDVAQSTYGGADNGRLAIWELGFEAAAKRPLTGWGPDAFHIAVQGSEREALSRLLRARSLYVENAHSYPLQVLVSTGVVGLLLFLMVVVWPLWSTRNVVVAPHGTLEDAALASFWAAAVGSFVALLTGVSALMAGVWLWLTLAILVAARAKVDKRVAGGAGRVLALCGIAIAILALVTAGVAVRADLLAAKAIRGAPNEAIAILDRAEQANPFIYTYWWMGSVRLSDRVDELERVGAGEAYVRPAMQALLDRLEERVSTNPAELEPRLTLIRTLVRATVSFDDPSFARRAVSVGTDTERIAPAHWEVTDAISSVYDALGEEDRVAEYREKTLRLAPDSVDALLRDEWGDAGGSEVPAPPPSE